MNVGFVEHKEPDGLDRPYKMIQFIKDHGISVKRVKLDYTKLSEGFRSLDLRNILTNEEGWKVLFKTLIHMSSYLPLVSLSELNQINSLKYIIKKATDFLMQNIDGVDILHAETQLPAFICSKVKEKTGIPYVFDMRGLLYEEQKAFQRPQKLLNLYYHIEKEAIINAYKVIVVSLAMKEYIVNEYNCEKNKVVIIPNAADINPNCAEYNEHFNIIYGGGFQYWERVQDYLKLAQLNCSEQVSYYLMGDGLDRNKIIDYINENYIDILYLGKRKHEKTLKIFSKMQVGIALSTNDIVRKVASPLKIFDYAACGLPVITVDVGQWSNLVKDYDCGIVIRNGSPQEFAEAIDVLRKREVWQIKSKNGKRMIEEKYNWGSVLVPLLDIYKME